MMFRPTPAGGAVEARGLEHQAHRLEHLGELGPAQRLAFGHHAARLGHRHGLAGGHVGRAADDLPLRAGTVIDDADRQPVGIRMLLARQNTADDESRGIPHPNPLDPLRLKPNSSQPLPKLRGRKPRIAIGLEPSERNAHNW